MQERLSAYASVIIAPPLSQPPCLGRTPPRPRLVHDRYVRESRASFTKPRSRPCYWFLTKERMFISGRVRTPHERAVEIPRSTLCFHKLNRLELRVLFTFNAALALDRQSTITTSPTRYRCKPLFPGTCVTKAAFLAAVFASCELPIGQKVPTVWMACRVLFGACGVENPLSKDGQRKYHQRCLSIF